MRESDNGKTKKKEKKKKFTSSAFAKWNKINSYV